jgi:hypothetical protein
MSEATKSINSSGSDRLTPFNFSRNRSVENGGRVWFSQSHEHPLPADPQVQPNSQLIPHSPSEHSATSTTPG